MVISGWMSCVDLMHGQLPFRGILDTRAVDSELAKNKNLHPGGCLGAHVFKLLEANGIL